MKIDVSCLASLEPAIMEWLSGLPTLERSDPAWIASPGGSSDSPTQGDILTIGPMSLIQEQLVSLMGFSAAPSALLQQVSEWERTKFDFDWRESLLKGLRSQDLTEVLQVGQSNTHPLRLQLVAVPPHTALSVHAHPGIELDIPLFGKLLVRNGVTKAEGSPFQVPRDLLCRQPHHCIGTPLGNFSHPPSPDELGIVRADLSQRVQAKYSCGGASDLEAIVLAEEPRVLRPGDCLFNGVGTVHRSYTEDAPCLLFVLGPNVHANLE